MRPNNCCSFVGGGAGVGDYAIAWAGAVIFDHVKIGDHAIVAAGAVVINDVKP